MARARLASLNAVGHGVRHVVRDARRCEREARRAPPGRTAGGRRELGRRRICFAWFAAGAQRRRARALADFSPICKLATGAGSFTPYRAVTNGARARALARLALILGARARREGRGSPEMDLGRRLFC